MDDEAACVESMTRNQSLPRLRVKSPGHVGPVQATVTLASVHGHCWVGRGGASLCLGTTELPDTSRSRRRQDFLIRFWALRHLRSKGLDVYLLGKYIFDFVIACGGNDRTPYCYCNSLWTVDLVPSAVTPHWYLGQRQV